MANFTNRSLQRNREVHANNASLAYTLFNSAASLIISSNKVELRIIPDTVYYRRLKDLLNDIAADHLAKRTLLDLAISGDHSALGVSSQL